METVTALESRDPLARSSWLGASRNPRPRGRWLRRGRQASRALYLALGLWSLSPAVVAQDVAPRELTGDERARELYLRGDRLYAEGSYDEAVAAFERAFQLSQRPGLLYNMANALERLGRYEEALLRLKDYAPHAPEQQKSSVLKRIAALEARVEAQRQSDGEDTEDAELPSADAAIIPSPAPAPLPAAGAAPVPAEEHAPASRLLGYAVGGAGLVSVGVGVAFGLSAASARQEVEDRCVDSGGAVLCPQAIDESLAARRNRALAADIFLGLGIAALGVGTYLVLDSDTESGSVTKLSSEVSSHGGNISLVTTF